MSSYTENPEKPQNCQKWGVGACTGMGACSGQYGTTCKSKVWQFFHKSGDKTVTCEVCQANLAYHGGTSSMKEHLKRKHPAEDPLKESERPACKQPKLDVFTKNRVCSPERSAIISDLIT